MFAFENLRQHREPQVMSSASDKMERIQKKLKHPTKIDGDINKSLENSETNKKS